MNSRGGLQNCQKGALFAAGRLWQFAHPWDNPGMAVVEEEPDPGAGPAVVIITVIVLIVLIGVLFYGLAVLHWFGFDQPPSVGAAPSVTPTPTPSATASAAASASASP
ncbi:MAG TPA: hypothetical protein VN913_09755 [Candidatus Binatus sp.]|nr:hypothetical protein [Candidatus Binatus sp.]